MLKTWKAEIEITEVGLKGKVEKSVHEVVQKKENRRGQDNQRTGLQSPKAIKIC